MTLRSALMQVEFYKYILLYTNVYSEKSLFLFLFPKTPGKKNRIIAFFVIVSTAGFACVIITSTARASLVFSSGYRTTYNLARILARLFLQDVF